jgi:hypothetical protein
MVALMATSSAFARKTSHHHFKRAAIDHQSATKPNPGGVERIQTTSRLTPCEVGTVWQCPFCPQQRTLALSRTTSEMCQ